MAKKGRDRRQAEKDEPEHEQEIGAAGMSTVAIGEAGARGGPSGGGRAGADEGESDSDASGSESDESSSESDDSGTGSSGSGSDASTSSSGGSSAPDVSSEPDDVDDADGEAFDKVNVSFEFFDPKEADFHGLKALLHTYLDGDTYDCSGLANAIIAQNTVGTVVKTGEDDDPVAVMTALGTARYAERPFMRQARAYALGKCGDAAVRKQFEKAWDSPSTALVINERLINAPPQLAPPLVQALLDEVAWATEDEPTQELRDSFKLHRYVLLSRAYSDPGPTASQRKKKKQKTAPGPPSCGPLIVYVRPEDEFLHARAEASFTWPVENRAVAEDELQPLRLALLVTAGAAAAARRDLDRVIGNAAAMAPPPPMGAQQQQKQQQQQQQQRRRRQATAGSGGAGKGKGPVRE